MTNENNQPIDQVYVETHKAEFLTPLQQVMTNAREGIFKVSKFFEESGVGHELIESAAERAANAAKTEFEAKAKEDPIRQIIDVLQKSASSGRDKEIIEQSVVVLEQQWKKWRDLIEEELDLDSTQGKVGNHNFLENVVLLAATTSKGAPTFVQSISGQLYIDFDVLGRRVLKSEEIQPDGDEKTVEVKPSAQCLNNVLIGLGIIQSGTSFESLRNTLPALTYDSASESPRFVQRLNKAEMMSTNVPDTKATLFLDDPRLSVSIPVSSLGKITDFPVLLNRPEPG